MNRRRWTSWDRGNSRPSRRTIAPPAHEPGWPEGTPITHGTSIDNPTQVPALLSHGRSAGHAFESALQRAKSERLNSANAWSSPSVKAPIGVCSTPIESAASPCWIWIYASSSPPLVANLSSGPGRCQNAAPASPLLSAMKCSTASPPGQAPKASTPKASSFAACIDGTLVSFVSPNKIRSWSPWLKV